MNQNIEIGKRIKLKREECGLTQEELGKAVDLNKSTIQRYETGKIEKIKLPVIQAIAQVLKVDKTIDDYFNELYNSDATNDATQGIKLRKYAG